MIRKFYILLLLLPYIIFTYVGVSSASSYVFDHPDKLPYPTLKFSPLTAPRIALENGMILYVLEDHEIPLVKISAVIRTGSVHDPIGKEGLAELTGDVMRTGGTTSLSGTTIDETLEFSACSLEISINRDLGSANLSVLKKNLEPALKILSDILQHPAFEDDKLHLAKALKIEEIKRIADDPQKLAFREFNRFMYQNNPRGRLASISSVKKINRDDLLEFHKTFFYPANIMISITGDITKAEAVNKMKKYFGHWKTAETGKPFIPLPEKQTGHIYFLEKDTPQSIIIHGNMAPAKKDKDAYAFEVLDFMLGSGGFRSRIFREIRSARGLSYSTGSFYKVKSEYGIFGAYAITGTESTTTVISLIRSIIEDAKKNAIKKIELDWAKKSINNSFIFSFRSVHQIAVQQMMNEYEKLSEDYMATFRDNIEKVQTFDVKNVAEKYLTLENAVVLVLGNEKTYQTLKSIFGTIMKVEATND